MTETGLDTAHPKNQQVDTLGLQYSKLVPPIEAKPDAEYFSVIQDRSPEDNLLFYRRVTPEDLENPEIRAQMEARELPTTFAESLKQINAAYKAAQLQARAQK